MVLLLFNIIQLLVLFILAVNTFYIFIFSIAGLFYKQKPENQNHIYLNIVVLIPAYREDEVIFETVDAALHQDYPTPFLDIVVIADSFQAETIQQLSKFPIKVIELNIENRTKAKALNEAMNWLDKAYDIAVILDADNLMAPDFLLKINNTFSEEVTVIQCHRKAKNTNTHLAILDSISEEINNHIFRKGHKVLGLPSALTGSGMAFDYTYFKSLMQTVTAVGGFDKELELKILKQKIDIEYLDNAIIFDEKTQKADVFVNQRRRWLAAQFQFFSSYFFDAAKAALFNRNFAYLEKNLQFVLLPRILLLVLTIASGFAFILCNHMAENSLNMNYIWIALVTLCISSFVISFPRAFYTIQTLKAILYLPKAAFLMIKAVLTLRGANNQFLHTRHSVQIKKISQHDRLF
jgi:cellulose synthase/poly-beta-1,6-N-acetylglucosamine synthase-like glycosyltransferase